jgi:hypothetical protein
MTSPKIGDTRPDELCSTGPGERCTARDVVHIPRENLRSLRRLADRQRELSAEVGPLRRQAALWRAGVRYDAGAQLLLQQLPDDLDLDDPAAVRAECSAVVAAVLGAREQVGS